MEAVIAAIQTAASAIGGNTAAQVGQVLIALINALPSIETGVMSAEPFVAAAITLIKSGGQPDDAAWAAQLAALSAQTTALDNQVAADEAAQPST